MKRNLPKGVAIIKHHPFGVFPRFGKGHQVECLGDGVQQSRKKDSLMLRGAFFESRLFSVQDHSLGNSAVLLFDDEPNLTEYWLLTLKVDSEFLVSRSFVLQTCLQDVSCRTVLFCATQILKTPGKRSNGQRKRLDPISVRICGGILLNGIECA